MAAASVGDADFAGRRLQPQAFPEQCARHSREQQRCDQPDARYPHAPEHTTRPFAAKTAGIACRQCAAHYRRDDGTSFGNGILFEGDAGRIFVNRGRLTGTPIDDLTQSDKDELNQQLNALYKNKPRGDHMGDFFDCVTNRSSKPISDVWTHHRTMTSCHQCSIAIMLGRELQWDPEKEVFIGDDQANALMSRPRREGFDMESTV